MHLHVVTVRPPFALSVAFIHIATRTFNTLATPQLGECQVEEKKTLAVNVSLVSSKHTNITSILHCNANIIG